MRTRLVITLSAGAVLVTTAGIAIGSQGIGNSPVSASASSSSSPSSTPGTGSVAASAPAVAPATVGSTPVPGSPTQLSYVAGDAATLVIDSAGGTLRIVTFAPHPGWFTVRLEQSSATRLEVRLESASGQVRFAADLVNGVVVPQLEVGAGPSGSVPDTSAPGGSAPDNSAPGASGPDSSTASSSSTPGSTSPGSSTPGSSSSSTSSPDDDGDGGGGDNSGPGGGDDSGEDDNSGSGGGG